MELAVRLKFLKARPVPYAITGKIEVETKRLQDEGTIEPVQFLEQTASIVPILKPDNSVHTYMYIHVDYLLTFVTNYGNMFREVHLFGDSDT